MGDGLDCEPERLPVDRCLQDNGLCHAAASCTDLHFQGQCGRGCWPKAPWSLSGSGKVFNVYLLESERTGGGGAARRRDRIPRGLRALSAEPDAGLELTNREIKSHTLNRLSHPGAPQSTLVSVRLGEGTCAKAKGNTMKNHGQTAQALPRTQFSRR